MIGARGQRRVWRAVLVVTGLATLSACRFQATFAATCSLFPLTPHGPPVVPGSVSIDADLPVFVAPGEAFAIRVDDLGGDPSIVSMSHAGGYISVTGAVSPSGTFWITSFGQELDFTATGTPGELIEVAVVRGYAFFGDPVTGGASCEVDGDGAFRQILLREPA